ncbi:MAG TPA: hypothetical protein EYG55_09765 [Gemmatimonadetes bacterium]|nr:hypothetical protein [Gemmatimonadota bacterium]
MIIGDLVVIKKSAIKHYRRKDFNLAAENETPVLILAVNEYTIMGFYNGGVRFIDHEDLTALGDR